MPCVMSRWLRAWSTWPRLEVVLALVRCTRMPSKMIQIALKVAIVTTQTLNLKKTRRCQVGMETQKMRHQTGERTQTFVTNQYGLFRRTRWKM